jgi:hypothetical protein
MAQIMAAEDVVKRIEAAFLHDRGAVGIRLQPAAPIVRQNGEQFRVRGAAGAAAAEAPLLQLVSTPRQNALDLADGNPIDLGDLGNRHAVLHPIADTRKMRLGNRGRRLPLCADLYSRMLLCIGLGLLERRSDHGVDIGCRRRNYS